jgi:hypothetical protein
MNSPTRMILFIGISIYLIALGFLIPAINKDVTASQIEMNSQNNTISGDTQFNFVTSITSLPIWFNTIFIIIPFILWLLLLISFFTPTVNAGA